MENRKSPITGREGSPIELTQAATWTKHYRDRHPGQTISQFFGKEILEKILCQPGCLGIRFYYAYDEPREGRPHLIITGVMSDGTDQIHTMPREEKVAAAPGGEVLMGGGGPVIYTVGEMSQPCPGSPGCPSNVLTGKKS